MDPTLEHAVERWHGAGLLDDDTVTAIRRHEAQLPVPAMAGSGTSAAAAAGVPAPPLFAPPAQPPVVDVAPSAAPGEGPSGIEFVAEGIAYVGAALALGFGVSLFGNLWQDMSSAGRILLAVVATLVVGAAAAALGDSTRGSTRRLGTVLAALSVVGVALTTLVILNERTELEEHVIALFSGLAGIAAGIPVHLRRASWPTTLALGAAVLTSVFAGAETFDLIQSSAVVGVILMGIGLSWAALGWSGHLQPRSAFQVTGLLAGGIGVQVLAIEEITTVALVIGLVIAALVLGVSLREKETAPAVLGGLGITVFAPQLVFDVFGETLGAPLAVFVAGVALVGVSVLILRKERSA